MAIRFINGNGQERWQPSLPDGRRMYYVNYGLFNDGFDWIHPRDLDLYWRRNINPDPELRHSKESAEIEEQLQLKRDATKFREA